MELKRKFKVVLHKEAHEFLANLDEKTRKKIIQTFDRASLLLDAEVFEKLANTDILAGLPIYYLPIEVCIHPASDNDFDHSIVSVVHENVSFLDRMHKSKFNI